MSIVETSAISVELPAPTSVPLMLTSGRSIWIWQQPVAAADPSRPWSPWSDPGAAAVTPVPGPLTPMTAAGARQAAGNRRPARSRSGADERCPDRACAGGSRQAPGRLHPPLRDPRQVLLTERMAAACTRGGVPLLDGALVYERLHGADSRTPGRHRAAVADACLLGIRDVAAAARFQRVPDRQRWSLNMTATTVKASRLAAVRARVRTRSTEAVVFSTAA